MLDVIHREARDAIGGWAFDCPAIRGIEGGGRTFSESVLAAEHAARQQLSREAGHLVDLEEAARQLRHTRVGSHLPRTATAGRAAPGRFTTEMALESGAAVAPSASQGQG